MKSKFYSLKPKIITLRKSGKTYGEIIKIIGESIPKSTLSDWCSKIYLNSKQKKIIDKKIKNISERGRTTAWAVNKERREKYLKSVVDRNRHLSEILKNKNIAKIALAMLYLGEGCKTKKGSLMFGNSNFYIISLFLHLLRFCYNIDENKFRCTLQCRADQNIKKLEKFWSKITKIPLSQFYSARIDPRTIGAVSKNLEYKGVCRIDYFSADLFWDLMQIPKTIYKGP